MSEQMKDWADKEYLLRVRQSRIRDVVIVVPAAIAFYGLLFLMMAV